LLAFENANEMNFSRLEIVHTLSSFYASFYAKAFGPLYDFSDLERFPAVGKPGDVAYDNMLADDRLEVDRAVANVGKALEAYMRKLATGPSRVDRYLAQLFDVQPGYGAPKATSYAVSDAGSTTTQDLLTPQQERGLIVFAKSGCIGCHSGAQLSDDDFHNLGVSTQADHAIDEGRTAATITTLQMSPFNTLGPFYEGEQKAEAPKPAVLGGFRTPSLRNLGGAEPYGHNGVFATLEEVVDFHLAGGGSDPSTFAGSVDPKLKKVDLSNEDRAALIEFLKALKGEYPGLPWGQWPAGNG
jgi:cytochrome c peroxidase